MAACSSMYDYRKLSDRRWIKAPYFQEKESYEGVRFNVISVKNWWVGVQLSGKKRYVTFEWPLT